MYNPISTYRIQFHKEFTFAHLEGLLSYVKALGVSTIYASPVTAAVPESTHGYDGVDPLRINPEIGTEEQLRSLSQQLKEANMGWVQDIVPNHMAYYITNEWLADVLEKGSLSRYATFFDTSLASSFFHGRIQAPFLPASMEETLAEQKLVLKYDQQRFVFEVSGETLPVKPGSYATILRSGPGEYMEDVAELLRQLDQLKHADEPKSYALAWYEFREQLQALMTTEQAGNYVRSCLVAVNQNPALLQQLADEQHYRFCDEPETRHTMSYRRFFTVNALICLNMADEDVFQEVHKLVKALVEEGVFQGLRIDHIDGLFDPAQYLDRLRQLAGDETYIVAEKILQADEQLPTEWPIQGTTGYDFLAMVNNLLTNESAESRFRDFYHTLIGSDTSLQKRIRYRKAYFLAQYMGGELTNLYQYFLAMELADDESIQSLGAGELKLAIGELLIECPVYRYYGNAMPLPADEVKALRQQIDTIRQTKPELNLALSLLEKALLDEPAKGDDSYNRRALSFYQRLMQFSGPLMAKGVEDTLLYTYNNFVGHNEVGDSPEEFGLSTDAFHQAMQQRQQYWPLAQNTTTTHDTKRGEDVRARLNVLTDLADEWLAEVKEWQKLNTPRKAKNEPEELTLDLNDEYFIYQNLLGAYPMPGQDTDNFEDRFHLYLEKALQEAKRHTTGWVVEEEYHQGVRAFTDRLFDEGREFWRRFKLFHHKVADLGVVNSLAQLILKCTCPGVPDIYQGAEGWDLSLVDPDNRRPVDFSKRQQWLSELVERRPANDETLWADLWRHRFDGRIKFWLTHILLRERQQQANTFAQGGYVPLSVKGVYDQHIIAFARQYESECYVVILPLNIAQLCRQQKKEVTDIVWKDTEVVWPGTETSIWRNCITEQPVESLRIQAIFDHFPFALLKRVSNGANEISNRE
jgi:(1->4)-alpha-D-glucan 1-alpha-D-glucosylmutase